MPFVIEVLCPMTLILDHEGQYHIFPPGNNAGIHVNMKSLRPTVCNISQWKLQKNQLVAPETALFDYN